MRIRIPRLGRRARVVRNLLCGALAVFLLLWYYEFPPLTVSGLLRRAEKQNLLEEETEILFTTEGERGETDFYGRNGDLLVQGNCRRGWIFLSGDVTFLPGPACGLTMVEREDDYEPVGLVVSLLEEAASGTMTLELEMDSGWRQSYVTQGQRLNPWTFRFPVERADPADEGETLAWSGKEGVRSVWSIQLYDQAGALLWDSGSRGEQRYGGGSPPWLFSAAGA